MPTLRKHSHISHQQPILKVCYTCRIGFQTKLNYAEHVKNEHDMPILDLEQDEIDLTRSTVSSISGGVNYYDSQPEEKDLDIVEFMFRKRKKVSRFIQKRAHKFPQKLQVNVEMTLQNSLEEEIEKVSVYFNTETVTCTTQGFRMKATNPSLIA